MVQQNRGPLELEGVIRLKVINSPAYLNRMALEAYSLFDSNDALIMLTNIATNEIKPGDPNVIPPAFAHETSKLIHKYAVTGGTLVEFMPGAVTFESKEKVTIRHDVLAEITLKDGIIDKIEPVPQIKPF
jgi:hypothetical protein